MIWFKPGFLALEVIFANDLNSNSLVSESIIAIHFNPVPLVSEAISLSTLPQLPSCTIVNYDSSVIPDLEIPHITTLES